MSILALLEQKRKEMDKNTPNKKLFGYFRAIELNDTERYWDYRDMMKGRMTHGAYVKKYWNKKKENIFILE